MKTKLLAVTMMGLATIGSFFGVVSASGTSWADAGTLGLKGNTGVGEVKGVGSSKRTGASLLNIIQNGINWVLGMLSLITLCVVLWGGFQMVTAAGDDGKYKKGFTILKQAGIGLVIIMLAWIIVSVVFWLVGSVGKSGVESGEGTN